MLINESYSKGDVSGNTRWVQLIPVSVPAFNMRKTLVAERQRRECVVKVSANPKQATEMIQYGQEGRRRENAVFL